jgi:CRISPR-associated protein Cas1
VPAVKIEQVVIFGNVQVTTPAIVFLLTRGIDAVFLSATGRYYGRLLSSSSRFGELRQRQMRLVDDAARSLPVAQQFVAAKLMNQRTLLQAFRLHRDHPVIGAAIASLSEMIERVPRTRQISSLMGVEGRGSATYFGAFKELLRQDLGFVARVRHPPRDPVNALLSFGYTLLAYAIQSVVESVGLDPYLGFLHAPAYSRPSLVLDLMEEFRPAVVDLIVLRMINRRELTGGDFRTDTGDPERPVLLGDEGRRRFLAAFEGRIRPREFGEEFGQERAGQGFRRLFERQARQIARIALGQQASYQPWVMSPADAEAWGDAGGRQL